MIELVRIVQNNKDINEEENNAIITEIMTTQWVIWKIFIKDGADDN